MAGTLRSFLELLSGHFPPALPASKWRLKVGGEVTAALAQARLIRRTALGEGDAYPCPHPFEPGCPRRIVTCPVRGLAAVCGDRGQCEDVVIPGDEGFTWSVHPRVFIPCLSELMGLSEAEADMGASPPWPLGSTTLAGTPLRFYFAPGAALGLIDPWLRPMSSMGRSVLVVPLGRGLGRALRRRCEDLGILLLPLDEALDVENGALAFRWGSFLLGTGAFQGLTGPDLWPERWLVLDPAQGRHWLGGVPLKVPGGSKAEGLLLLLALSVGNPVGRVPIAEALWPDEVSPNASFKAMSIRASDELIRGAVRDLRKAVGSVLKESGGMPFGSAAEVIVTHRSHDIALSGYELQLPPHRVEWLSRPPEDRQP